MEVRIGIHDSVYSYFIMYCTYAHHSNCTLRLDLGNAWVSFNSNSVSGWSRTSKFWHGIPYILSNLLDHDKSRTWIMRPTIRIQTSLDRATVLWLLENRNKVVQY